MEVYIEDVIIDNLVLNFLLLYLTKKLFKSSSKNIFVFLGALVGTAGSVLVCFFSIEGVYLFLFKFALGTLMIITSFGFKRLKQFALQYLCFMFNTAVMGGVSFLISFSFGEAVISDGKVYYELSLPMGIVWLVVSFFGFLLLKVIKIVKKRSEKSNFIYSATLCVGNKSVKTKIYLDTGNTLEESGRPITLISQKEFKKLFPEVSPISIILGNTPKEISGARYKTTQSVGGNKKMLIFEVDKLIVDQGVTVEHALMGLSGIDFERKLDCGLVAGLELFNGERYAS